MPNYRNIAKQIADSRISFLFNRAHSIFLINKELANRYVALAKKYAARTKIKIPHEWKKRICHKCKSFLYPGINCRIRLNSKKGKGTHVSLTCLECNATTRYYIKS
jgi:ribonuclease P protein subunit RPR2